MPATKPRQSRLTDAELAAIDEIARDLGQVGPLSRTDVIRELVKREQARRGRKGRLQVPPRDCGAAARGGSLTHGASCGFVERFGADHDHRLDSAGRPDRDPRPVPGDDARPARRRRPGLGGRDGGAAPAEGEGRPGRQREPDAAAVRLPRPRRDALRAFRDAGPAGRARRPRGGDHPRPLGLEPARRHGRVHPRLSRARGW